MSMQVRWKVSLLRFKDPKPIMWLSHKVQILGTLSTSVHFTSHSEALAKWPNKSSLKWGSGRRKDETMGQGDFGNPIPQHHSCHFVSCKGVRPDSAPQSTISYRHNLNICSSLTIYFQELADQEDISRTMKNLASE